MQCSSTQGKPPDAGVGPLPGLPLEGPFRPPSERPEPAGGNGRTLRPPRGPHPCATAQELYLRFQEIRLEAEALRDALAPKRP